MSFHKYICLCNHHYNHDREYSHPSKNLLVSPCVQSPLPAPLALATIDPLQFHPFQNLINWNPTVYSFFVIYPCYCMYLKFLPFLDSISLNGFPALFTFSPVDGIYLTVTNKATMNIYMKQVFVGTYIFISLG